MKNQYRCDACGCYLDPGEGLLCDECRQEVQHRIRTAERYREYIVEQSYGQYQMRLEAM